MESSLFYLIPNKPVYLNTDDISVTIVGEHLEHFNHFSFNILKVCEDYDFYEKTLSGNIEALTLKAGLSFESEGVFYIASIILSQTDSNGVIIKDKAFNIPSTLAFKVVKDNVHNSFSFEEIADEKKRIYNIRASINYSGFGQNTDKSKTFKVYIFCRGILLTMAGFYDQYELIPFEGIGYSDIIDYLNKFLKNTNVPELPYPLHGNEIQAQSNPGLIVHFPLVYSNNMEDAGEITENEVTTLLKTFALTRGSYGMILGSVLVDLETGQPFHRIYRPSYTGNLLTGLDFGENPRKNKIIHKTIKENGNLNLCISVFSECLNESNIELSYAKLWSILEVLAEKYKDTFHSIGRYYLDNTQKKNYSKIQITNKDKVRELLRRYSNKNHLIKSIIFNSSTIKPEEYLTVWYRHRNCLVHSGGCNPSNILHCKTIKSDYKLCNQAHYSIIKEHIQRNKTTDSHYSALQSIIRAILFEETS